MRVYEELVFNLKAIRFKDTKDYIDAFLAENGVSYEGIGFYFWGDGTGQAYEKLLRKYPEFRKYLKKKFKGGSGEELVLASQSPNWMTDHQHSIAPEDVDAFCEVLHKIPHTYNYPFMSVQLDRVNWDKETVQCPFYITKLPEWAVPGYGWGGYYANCIRLRKEFDYGNKLNLVEVMVDRTSTMERLADRPAVIERMIEVFGKPIGQCLYCRMDEEEEARVEAANAEWNSRPHMQKWAHWFEEFKHPTPQTVEEITNCVITVMKPIEGFSPKKAIVAVGKRCGYRYAGCRQSIYTIEKRRENNQVFRVTFEVLPFESLIEADICAIGYNFQHPLGSAERALIQSQEAVDYYVERVMAYAVAVEEEYGDLLDRLYGKTPDWYLLK